MDKASLLEVVNENSSIFRCDFSQWLDKNMHVWREFESRALRVAARRTHYAARTIWEVIRFESDVAENQSAFKLNNNYVPDCARLFGITHPTHKAFFETRWKPSALRVA